MSEPGDARPIHQGDVFWFDAGVPTGSGPGYRRPHVVVQNNRLNHSRIGTVVLCELTTNLRLERVPGNVGLAEGEGNLPRRSVVNVTQLVTVDKRELSEHIGRLRPAVPGP